MMAKSSTGPCIVVGAGMMGRVTCVTEGDLGCSGGGPTLCSEPSDRGNSKTAGAAKESERLIVVLTLGESREERRGRSRDGRAIDEGASNRWRSE